MASILWPIMLVILLTGISKTVSFTIDSVDDGANDNASHLVAKEIKNGYTPTSSQEHSTPNNNSKDNKEETISEQEKTTPKNKHKITPAKTPALEDVVLITTTWDMPTSTTKQNIPTTTTEDMPTSTTKQIIPTTTAEDMPTSTTKQNIPTITIEKDSPTNTIKEDMPINEGKEQRPINNTEKDVPANTTKERVSISTNEEDMPTIATTTIISTSSVEEQVPTDSPIAVESVVFVRSGEPTEKDMSTYPVKKYKPTVQVTKESCEKSSEKEGEVNTNTCGEKKKTCDKNENIDISFKSAACCCSQVPKCCPEAMQKVHEAYRTTLKSLEVRLERLQEDTKSIFNRLFAVDCSDVTHTKNESGLETFYLENEGRKPVSVLCDMETEGGGWTVVQRRDPKFTAVSFERGWHDYKIGFGNPNTEYWVGLQNIHAWTNTRQYELRIEITDYEGKAAYAHYRRFYLDGEDQGYRLHVSGYRGTAGDALTNRNTPDNFTAEGMMFTTYDRDHDMAKNVNCAVLWKSGGWWYNCCSWSNLNGLHWKVADGSGVGINWHPWRNREYLRTSTMMIRPSKYP